MTPEAIDQSNNYFKQVVENSLVGVIVLSNKCTFVYANEFFCTLLGYTKQELDARKIDTITHPDDIALCNKAFRSIVLREKDEFQIEKRYITKKGDPVWCEMNISASRNPDGSVELLTGMINDISSRKLIEKQHLESQELFSNIFKSSSVPLVISSIKYKTYLDINEAFTHFMGYTRDEIIGKKTNEITLFESEAERSAMFDKVKTTGFINGVEINCRTKTGEIIPVVFSISTVKIYDQDCLISNAVSITDQKVIENAAKESEKNYKMLIDFLPDGLTIHKNGKIVFVNDIAIKMLEGSSENDFIDKSILDIIKVTNENIQTAVDTERGTSLTEEIFTTLNGNPIHVEVASIPYIYAGSLTTLIIFRDITERKNSEKELIKAKEKAEESDRLKSAFLATMSHEIRTPMNAIKGFAQLLEDSDLTQEKRRLFIKIINQRTDDLLMLINDILDTAKIEAGQMSISETSENISFLFNDIHQFFISQQDFAQKEDLDFRAINELDDTHTIFKADFFRLRQILINLINNAIKFTNKGHIYFGCRLLANGTLLFYVEDTGVGISEEYKDLVFAPFRQLNDNHLSRQQSGTGLGLSIVRGLLKLMNGKVWFESEVGKGTTFFFSIPFIQLNNLPIGDIKRQALLYNWDTKTILVVEDDNFNFQLIIEFLKKTKVKILHATNGLEALSVFKKNQDINITLMDIQLPDINGFELTKMFQLIKPQTKVIAQTAYAAEMDKKRALSVGCIDYIPKPIDQNKLLNMIQKYI